MSIVSVSELDPFGKPSVQTSIEHTTEKDHYPISSMIESGPLEFTITGSGDKYLDLSSVYLHLTASISVGGVTTPTEGRQSGTSQQLRYNLINIVVG